MNQVKIIEEFKAKKFENDVNEWLLMNTNIKIIDMKYATQFSDEQDIYSVLIIYEVTK